MALRVPRLGQLRLALPCTLVIQAAVTLPVAAAPAEEEARQPTREEIEAFLESRALPRSEPAAEGSREVPPPPPRHRGIVLEASPGVVLPLGALEHVSPPSPWLQVSLGYEPKDWFMVLVNADFTIANTRYAARPPEPRTYAHYAVGGAARFQLPLAHWLATHAQLELGASQVTEEVLLQYGFTRADQLNFHYGGRLGFEWLQSNPHLALGLQGTYRVYPGLDRANDARMPAALLVGPTLRYAF